MNVTHLGDQVSLRFTVIQRYLRASEYKKKKQWEFELVSDFLLQEAHRSL